jgi:hypothetical protein
VPGGVDLAWQSKHFIGTPVPGASLATLNLAQLVLAMEFTVAEIATTANDLGSPSSESVTIDMPVITDAVNARDTDPVE